LHDQYDYKDATAAVVAGYHHQQQQQQDYGSGAGGGGIGINGGGGYCSRNDQLDHFAANFWQSQKSEGYVGGTGGYQEQFDYGCQYNLTHDNGEYLYFIFTVKNYSLFIFSHTYMCTYTVKY